MRGRAERRQRRRRARIHRRHSSHTGPTAGVSPLTIDTALRIIDGLPPVRVALVDAAAARLAAGERPSAEEIADGVIERTLDLAGC